ncbi:hypothetical protein Kpol_1016p22 [Vanderwaltozyma polyspora DSM 70294]|uniref:Vacuolar protein sorting-associated protein 51 homolog n=1 Tax=Vanderwaltozyma polyspora (strain ATCC 22028 / DSM 70294 / BCRC 21397 / CBS 2163 / NBRC 10782 / NRRL Y-8283 / UCD 57-17) TaxID=436907 RepID=A7TNT7_VANPO|nr:uncharacterized protein Kpol_1016p22 [Vanderwaltozyma polyspora DSM 70294]EDO16080.1 hypothetical protein Kpol_1016p22 [Vanderwaltozyma polyspora DSM 70294]
MTEQISHKKSLRIKNSNKDKRLQLKEFYKLNEEVQQDKVKSDSNSSASSPPPIPLPEGIDRVSDTDTQEVSIKENKEVKPVTDFDDTDSIDSRSLENMEDKSVKELYFKDLLHMHNKLLSKETETNNSIKNTIYENYYDLIKVNDLLKGMVDEKSQPLNELKETIEFIIH